MKLLMAIVCSVALLAGCGSDSDGDSVDNTTPATATTSTAAPQSTVTIATVAPTTAPVTVATIPPTTGPTPPPATADTVADDSPASVPDPEATADSTVDTSSDSTSAAGTAVSAAPTTSAAPAAAAAYGEVAPPGVPAVSAPVLSDNSHPDGVYYATVTEGGDPPPAAGEVVFELVQLFRGDDCIAHFGDDDADSCVNDYGVETDPTSTIAVRLQDQFISVADAATQKSHRITGTELYSLIHGDEPSVGAPEDYSYVGFGYFLTISGGEVTRLEQWWTP